MAKEAKTIKPDWGMVLSNRGVVINVTVRWYKGQDSLSAADLDLEKQAKNPAFQELFALGKKLIIPKELFKQFRRMETRARSGLDRIAFDTPFGSFVPYAAVAPFEKKITEIEAEFKGAVKDMIAKWPKHRTHVMDEYAKLANKLFTNGDARKNTARLRNAVRNAMPTREELPEYFEFAWEPFHIATPSELVADQKKAEALAEGRAIKFQVNKKLADKYSKQSSAAIDSFIGASIKKMRGVVNELVVASLKSIEKNDGVVVPRIAMTLKQMVDHFKVMNVWGDEDIEAKLSKLKDYIDDDSHDLGGTDSDRKKQAAHVKEMLKELRAAVRERVSEDALSLRKVRHGVEL